MKRSEKGFRVVGENAEVDVVALFRSEFQVANDEPTIAEEFFRVRQSSGEFIRTLEIEDIAQEVAKTVTSSDSNTSPPTVSLFPQWRFPVHPELIAHRSLANRTLVSESARALASHSAPTIELKTL